MQGTLSGQSSQIVPAGGDGTEVTAIPSAGFRFIRWSDGVTTASRTDTDVTADLTVTAEFEAVAPVVTYEVTATVDGTGGTVRADRNEVAAGDKVVITATPDTGYKIADFTVNGQNKTDELTDNTYTILAVDSDIVVVVAFEKISYTLTYTAGEGGSIGGAATQTVQYGESGTAVTAVPDGGYRFVQWSDGVRTASRTDTDVRKNLSVTAQFAEESIPIVYHTVAAEVQGSGGTVTTNASEGKIEDGTVLTVTLTPDTGYQPASLLVNGEECIGATENNVYSVTVTEDIVVVVAFEKISYTLTYTAGEGGSIGGAATQTVQYGESGTAVTAVPDECGVCDLWCGYLRTTNLRTSRSGAAAKHTPRKRQQGQHGKPNRKRGGTEPSPLNRLRIGCRFFRRAWLSILGFISVLCTS